MKKPLVTGFSIITLVIIEFSLTLTTKDPLRLSSCYGMCPEN